MEESVEIQPADVFISYASEDREAAERLAESLAVSGWSVWWDREIAPGTVFSHVIEDALSSARCIVVLWSPAAVESHWVQAEASDALSRGALVPAIIEDCTIPLEFRRIEAAQIGRHWKPDDFEFRALIDAVAAKLDQSPPVQPLAADRSRWQDHVRGAAG